MTDASPRLRPSRPDPLSVLWRLLGLPQTLLALLGGLALALILSSLVPQIPASARSEPQAWLAVQSGVPAPLRGPLWALGCFNVFRAVWFHLLVALLEVALAVRLVEAGELAWRATGRTRWTPGSFRFWSNGTPPFRAPGATAPEPERVRHSLRDLGYGTAPVQGTPAPTLVAARRAWGLWMLPVTLAAGLLALAGLLAAAWGWEVEDQQLGPGESLAAGHGTPYSLRLDSFSLEAGVPQAQATWLAGDRTVRQGAIRSARPLTVEHIAARLVDYVPFVRARGWDEEGRPLVLQAEGQGDLIPLETEIAFPSAEARPVLYLPKREFYLVLRFERARAGNPATLVVEQVKEDGAPPIILRSLAESGTVAVAGLRLELDLAYRPLVRLDYRPSLALSLAGLAVSVLAQGLAWLISPRLVWLAFGPDGLEALPQGDHPPFAGHASWLSRLVHALHAEAGDGA